MFDLVQRDICRFVGFGVSPVAHAGVFGELSHLRDIALKSIEIDHQGRGAHIFQRGADFGGNVQPDNGARDLGVGFHNLSPCDDVKVTLRARHATRCYSSLHKPVCPTSVALRFGSMWAKHRVPDNRAEP